MSKSNAFASDLLLLIFNNDAIATIGDTSGLQPSASAGNLYVSLHTADPGEAGDATSNETAYTGYARVAVPRNSSNWVVAGGDPDPASVSPAAEIVFGQCTASPGGDITHFGISAGTDGAGAELLLYSGPVTPNIVMAIGKVPKLAAGTEITED